MVNIETKKYIYGVVDTLNVEEPGELYLKIRNHVEKHKKPR